MTKQLTVSVDPDAAAHIEKRAGEIGLTPAQFVAALVHDDNTGEHADASDVADLEARWAEVEAGGETVPHEDVRRWLKTWGTPGFRPWSKNR